MTAPRPRDGIATRMALSLVAALALVLAVGLWAGTARISAAVIAHGSLQLESNLMEVQHMDGGLIAAIAVRPGAQVRQGDVLIELDASDARAENAILTTRLIEAQTQQARLAAKRDGLDEVPDPPDLDLSDTRVRTLLAAERRLFAGELANRRGQVQLLELSIEQTGREIDGLEAERAALLEEIRLTEESLARLQTLADQNLVQADQLNAVARDKAQLSGRLGSLNAAIARAHAHIAEIRLQITAMNEDARTEAQRELVAISATISELTERIDANEGVLSRTLVRAPVSGTIQTLAVNTIGGVIRPAEIIATIVPADADLDVALQVNPSEIDQLTVGQEARVRFTAFDLRLTPELVGQVTRISPAATEDPATGARFFAATVQLPDSELVKLGARPLLPGMPVEVHVTTGERTALSYFLRPLLDRFGRSLREE